MTQMIMNKIKILISSTALTVILAGGVFLVPFQSSAQGKTVAQLTPISGWSVKKMASGTDNAYCALSRQYNQNLVLTLGRNALQEYSLAIDFTDGTLNPDKAYSITLQPGPGQIRAYEMMPASARAIVIRLGYDESFFKSLNESGVLKTEIDGKNYHFNVSEFAKGEQDLMGCASGLKGAKSTTKIASSGFSAKKIENAEPIKLPIKQAIKQPIKIAKAEIVDVPKKAEVITPQPAPKVELAPVVKVPKIEVKKTPRAPIKIERVASLQEKAGIIKAPEKPVIIEAVKEPQKQIVMNKVSSKISKAIQLDPIPKVDNVAKARQASKAQAHMEAQKLAVEKAAKQKELEAQKIADKKAKELEDKAKKIAMQRQQEEQKALADATKLKAEQAKLAQENLAKEKLEAQKLAEQKLERAQIKNQRLVKQKAEQERQEQQVAEAKLERETLVREKLAKENLEAKNLEHKKANQKLEREQVVNAELDAIRAEKEALEKENRALYLEARKSRAAIDTAVVNTGNQALVKMREYEKKLKAAKADNLALSKEMEELRLIKEDGRLDAVVGDWDLEKSTKRYNEAEREIKRLGLLLEQQRTVHRQEKTDLEQMLFDPAVTDQAQRRRLAELELKLATAQNQLSGSGRGLSGMPAVPAPNVRRDMPRAPMEERVALTPTPRSSGIPSIVESQREQMEINRLNNQIKRQNQQLKAYQRQADVQVKTQKLAEVKPPLSQPSFPRLEETPMRVSSAPAPIKPVVRSPVSVVKTKVAPLQPVSQFGQNEIQKILNKAGVGINGRITKRGAGQYQWSAGKLKGQAQVVPARKVGSIDQFVKNFMALSKKACKGDFASLPAPNIGNAKAFEIACIGTTSNVSSSLLFMQRGEDIVVIGHEISADDMDVAMDARDRIAGSL